MRSRHVDAVVRGLLGLLTLASAEAASIQVILATDQTPGDAQAFQVATVSGGIWDRGGRILMSGRYKPGSPGAIDRNATWVSDGPGTTRELYADGDSVPYFSMPVGGPVIAISVPIIQPRFRGYIPPADYWAWQSAVVTRLPEIPESRACWVDWLEGPPGLQPTQFIMNDLEEHIDGAVRFLRPSMEGAIIRKRASAAGLESEVTFRRPDGSAVQIFVNGSYTDGATGRGGSVVWIARSDLTPVASQRRGVVRMIAASAGMGLPSLPGGAYSFLRVMGVDPAGELLWEVGGPEGIAVQRGDPGSWTSVLAPGMEAPAVRGGRPTAATPVSRLSTIQLVDHGAGILANVLYSETAGDLARRSALLMHDGSVPRLMAFTEEIVDGTAAGTRLQNLSVGAQDAPNVASVAFIGSVRGGTQPFETQALLQASEFSVRLLARQFDPLPIPANVDRIVQFRLPVLSAAPDGRVAFAAEVEFMDGTRREILYVVTPGLPNRYEVMLTSGDTFTVQTPDGPRVATVQRVNAAAWCPGTFDKLLVSVDLQVAGTSAVLLVGPEGATEVQLDAAFVGDRIRLRWPQMAEGMLEVAGSLDAGSWVPVEVPSVIVDGQRQVDVSTEGVARFFRFR
jgi:hypothetical protein